jgi:hypothetical protein
VAGNAGTPATILGAYFPGGPISTIAPYVSPTPISYYDYPDGATHSISVPPGGQIVVVLS